MSQFVNGPNYLALPRNSQKWLIQDLIPTGGLANLYGRPKTHKSFVALHMAAAISNPQIDAWQGFAVKQHGRVVYLQIDTPRTAWGERMVNLSERTAENGGPVDFSEVYFADMQMVPTFPGSCLDPDQLKWLADELLRLQPILVIIDTLREAHNADENDSTAMRNVIGQLVSTLLPLASKPGMLLLSHAKKVSAFAKAGGDDLMDDARGSSYVVGRMDNVIGLTEARMTWKGRMGADNVGVEWDDDTLEVKVDTSKEAERIAMKEVCQHAKAKGGKIVKAELAKALRVKLGWADSMQKTALRRLEEGGYFRP